MNQCWIGMLVVVGGGIVLALAIWGIMLFVQQDKKYQKQQDNILQNGICVLGRIIKHQDPFSSISEETFTSPTFSEAVRHEPLAFLSPIA